MRRWFGALFVLAAGCSRSPASQSDREAALGKAVASAEWSRRYARPRPPGSSPAERQRAAEAAYKGVDGAMAADMDTAATLYRDGRQEVYGWILGCRYQLERKGLEADTASLLRAAVAFGKVYDRPPSGIPISVFTLNYKDRRVAGLSHEAAVAWLLEHHAEL